MKTYYAVVTNCYDNGKVTSNMIDTKQSKEKPESTFKSTRRCDVYVDWFDSKKEALGFIEETKNA